MPNTPVQGLPYPALSDPANGPVALQNLATALEDYKTIVRCTSSTRPAHVTGRIIYETDTNLLRVSVAGVWMLLNREGTESGEWVNFQPNVSGLPTTTNWARWRQNGRTVQAEAKFTATGAAAGEFNIFLPKPMLAGRPYATGGPPCGTAIMHAPGQTASTGICVPGNANLNTVQVYSTNVTNQVWGIDRPITWSSGMELSYSVTYETGTA